MNGPQRRPAVALVFDDETQSHQVENLVELLATDHHLFVDAPKVLRSTTNFRLDTELVELGRERRHHFTEISLALRLARGDHLFDLGVPLGVQRGKT